MLAQCLFPRASERRVLIVGPWQLEFVNQCDNHLELCLSETWGVHLELPAVMSKKCT